MNKHQRTERLWCFRRWSRKPWAAFAGLCRLKIGVLSVGMSIILLATNIAGAQTVGTDSLSQYRTLHLDTVQVRAARGPAGQPSVMSQTRFLFTEKSAAPLQTAESALRLLPSVDVRERGGKGVQADISLWGGSFDQTKVMLNGIDFTDARTGHQSHSLPVDIDCVSDIRLVDGTASVGALSGAVDFRVRPLEDRYMRVHASGGRWGYAYGNLSGAYTREGLTVFAAGSYRRSDGYRYNTDFSNVNCYTLVTYRSARAGFFEAQGGYQTRKWGSNGFYSLSYPDQYEQTRTGLASLSWIREWGRLTVRAAGSFRENSDRFEMQRGDPDNIPFNYHTTYNAGAEASATWKWFAAGETTLGANYGFNRLLSTAMGEQLSDPSHKIPGGEGYYPKGKSRNVVTGWLNHEKEWDDFSVQGMGSVISTPYGTAGTFGVQLRAKLTDRLWIRSNVISSLRLPTFTDLYYNVAAYHPDPDLDPEKAVTCRISCMYAKRQWSVGVETFYRRTRRVIDWEQHPDGDWYSTQLNALGTVGTEVSARYVSEGWFRLASLAYGYIHTDKNVVTGYISKYALDYMRHKVTAVVGVGFLRDFTFTLTGTYGDRNGSYIAADGSQKSYSPYLLVDGRLSWERGWGQIYADVTNITNSSWCDFGGLPMPGAWAAAGVVITIN